MPPPSRRPSSGNANSQLRLSRLSAVGMPISKPALIRQCQQIRGVDDPGYKTGLLFDCGAHMWCIKREPAWMPGYLAVGVDGDDFKISVVAELHHQVVRCHALVLSAARDLHARGLSNVFRALLQAVRGDDNVIKRYSSLNGRFTKLPVNSITR